MTAKIYTMMNGEQEVHYISLPELGKTIYLGDNKVALVNVVPSGAEENIWDAAVYSKLENARGVDWGLGINPIDLLYILCEVKQQLGE